MTALEEIKKALEGVTPGPWITHGGLLGHKGDVFSPTAKSVQDCHHIARCFAPKPDKNPIDDLQVLVAERDAIKVIEANARYIAAANPAAISELLSTLESLQREKEASEATATRYANEIIELRGELAKTASLLVVQADRADAAEAELDSRTRALDEAEAGMKRLRETLHPFAEAADYYSTGVHRTPAPDALPCGPALIVAHLRAARTALASTGGEHHAE